MATSVQAVRELLERRFPDALPLSHTTVRVAATGVGPLDRILPGGGLPRGRLAVWAPGGGATALLRAACDAAVARGERAAWVDGGGAIAGAYWRPGPLLLRPRDTRGALEAAEVLLRSGGFGVVVVTGAGPLDEAGIRLSRAAREGGTALVTLSSAVPVASLRIASRLLPERYRWQPGPFGEAAEVERVTVRVRVSGLGLAARTDLSLAVVHHELRVSLDPGEYDRRGARRGARGRAAGGGAAHRGGAR